MNQSTTREGDPLLGFSVLIHATRHTLHLDNCGSYRISYRRHPFGLETPADRKDIWFVGAHATDMSVEVFMTNFRDMIDGTEDYRVHGLRVISTPYPAAQQPDQHHVFFEVWLGELVMISGETTDFSGAGNTARETFENVFALLSQLYKVEIERVTAPRVRISDLYDPKRRG